jgi:hypothetical protein
MQEERNDLRNCSANKELEFKDLENSYPYFRQKKKRERQSVRKRTLRV